MQKSNRRTNNEIWTFLALTLGLSSIPYLTIFSSGSIQSGGGLIVLGLMWCPGLAAIITKLIFDHSLRGLGWGWGKWKYQWLAYALPILYAGAVYAVTWLTGLGGFSTTAIGDALRAMGFPATSPLAYTLIFILVSMTVGILPGAISSLGEEIGWRGFLVPRLAQKFTFTQTALISGAIWTLWHIPLILFADYNNQVPAWWALPCFTLMVIFISFPFAWLRLRSGSLWTAVWLHTSHNMIIQQILTPLTTDTGITRYVIDEFGIGLVLTTALVAYLFYRRRAAVEQPKSLPNSRPLAQ
ncbi:MAG TPA: type II CAAX endopeptidase family protein [Anaerolineaceae bacterium]